MIQIVTKFIVNKHELLVQGIPAGFRNYQSTFIEDLIKGYKPKIINLSLPFLIKLRKTIINHLECCKLCPFHCATNRLDIRGTICNLASYGNIFRISVNQAGEKSLIPQLMVYFSGCNLRCPFCQSWDHIINTDGAQVTLKYMNDLIPYIKDAKTILFTGGEASLSILSLVDFIIFLKKKGMEKLILLDTNLYLSIELLNILSNFVDIFLADFKFTPNCAFSLLGIKNYFEIITENILYLCNRNERMILTHLLLPGHIDCCTLPILKWIKEHIPDIPISLMTGFFSTDKWKRVNYTNAMLREEEVKKAFYSAEKLNLKVIKSEVYYAGN